MSDSVYTVWRSRVEWQRRGGGLFGCRGICFGSDNTARHRLGGCWDSHSYHYCPFCILQFARSTTTMCSSLLHRHYRSNPPCGHGYCTGGLPRDTCQWLWRPAASGARVYTLSPLLITRPVGIFILCLPCLPAGRRLFRFFAPLSTASWHDLSDLYMHLALPRCRLGRGALVRLVARPPLCPYEKKNSSSTARATKSSLLT